MQPVVAVHRDRARLADLKDRLGSQPIGEVVHGRTYASRWSHRRGAAEARSSPPVPKRS
jgi:hypothetical protein